MFNYNLPPEKIAQRPIQGRHNSKLLWARAKDRDLEFIKDEVFLSFPSILNKNDLLVFNNSRVIPARFFCSLNNNEGKELEVLLLREDSVGSSVWQALAKPMKKFKTDLEFSLAENILAKVIGRTEDQNRLLLELSSPIDLLEAIKQNGSIPIPPYVRGGKSDTEDKEVYQTEYALSLIHI